MNDLLLTLMIGFAGGIGAALRYLVDDSVPAAARERFPWGTMIVNLSGSLILGLLTGLALGHPVHTVLAVGLLGGYTTFSTASLDSLRLLMDKRWGAAILNGFGMMAACTALSVLGIIITAH